MLRIIEEIKLLKEKKTKKTVWSLYIDLKSAFDKVNHKILMNKLRKMNI